MNSNALSVVSRLPQHYRLAGNDDGRRLEALPESLQSREDSLTGLKLLSHGHHSTYDALCAIRSHLEGLQSDDESTALCALKTAGAAIAENISARYPF